ncbi:MAG: hypothetical protein GY913_18240 [Proteobacteria bacterium]|nr:hypothetical protein [Pseudomonadota bacterium]MCP4918849.1 hypothetical protein [Pseudomonadota bacterium]
MSIGEFLLDVHGDSLEEMAESPWKLGMVHTSASRDQASYVFWHTAMSKGRMHQAGAGMVMADSGGERQFWAVEGAAATADYASLIFPWAAESVLAMRAASGPIVHMTTLENAAAIEAAGVLNGRSGIYAGPAGNAGTSGFELMVRTGLSPPRTYTGVAIPESALGSFSQPVPIGPFTGWQRYYGHHYTSAGSLDLTTGAFTRSGTK